MRRIERDQRCEAIAPVGDGFQQSQIRRLVGVEHLHIGTDRPRIGQRQADFKTELRGSIVQRRNLQRVVQLADNDTGLRVIRRAVARQPFQAVCRQPREP